MVARVRAGAFVVLYCYIQFVTTKPLVKTVLKLDNNIPVRTRSGKLNPNTHQKLYFCARLHMAAGLALYICPGRPGATS